MFVKDKRKNIQYEALSNLYEKPIKFIERISKLIHICLRKSEIGLGFTLGSEESVDKDESYTYVRKILDFSPAKYDGRLQVGDRILKINNLDVGPMSQADIVRLIRSLPIGDIITIIVSRTFVSDEDSDNAISICQQANDNVQTKLCHKNESKMENFHFIITITNDVGKISHCHASAGVLGISVECRATKMNSLSSDSQDSALANQAKIKKLTNVQKQFFVKSILKNGSAYQDCRLKIGDEILAVQGIDLQNGQTFIIDPLFDIYGDIFHFDLAAVFLRNLEKLNKLFEFKEMFEINSENPLHALKSLIKRAGDMYSSISIVVRRSVSLPGNEIIEQAYKNSKKKMNELCRIENIFELNPDYRKNYGNNRTTNSRYKDEGYSEIQRRSLHGRFVCRRDSDACKEESAIRWNLENYCIEESGYDKSMMESNNDDREELYSYFSKDDENTGSGNENNINDLSDNGDDYCGDLLDDSDINVVYFSINKE